MRNGACLSQGSPATGSHLHRFPCLTHAHATCFLPGVSSSYEQALPACVASLAFEQSGPSTERLASSAFKFPGDTQKYTRVFRREVPDGIAAGPTRLSQASLRQGTCVDQHWRCGKRAALLVNVYLPAEPGGQEQMCTDNQRDCGGWTAGGAGVRRSKSKELTRCGGSKSADVLFLTRRDRAW